MRGHRQTWHTSEVARRPWSRGERRVVLRGFLGRLTIAIEPLIIAFFFALLPVGLLLRRQEIAPLLAPIFAFAAITFLAYAVALMVPPVRAVFETFGPIYTVDGYVRYRSVHTVPPEYYVAVLSAGGETLGEWPLDEWPSSIGQRNVWPVMIEFTRYGGIHKIDGQDTGVLPAEIAQFGVGIAHGDVRHGSHGTDRLERTRRQIDLRGVRRRPNTPEG